MAGYFMTADPAPRFAIVECTRRQLVHDDETGGDVAVLGVSAIEFPGADLQDILQKMLLDHRAERTGAGMLPFPEPETDADRANELQHRIRTWADQNGLDARQEWEAYYGAGDQAPIGPTGASLLHLLEFVKERGIVAQPLAAVPADADDEPEEQLDDADDQDDDPDDGDPLAGVPAGRAWLGDPDQQFSDA